MKSMVKDLLSRPSMLENGNQDSSLLDAVSISSIFMQFRDLLVFFAFSVCICAYLCPESYGIFNLFVIILWYIELWRSPNDSHMYRIGPSVPLHCH
jgi:hypothetical protein